MNFFLKQKMWFFIAMFFLIVNAVMLTGMFMHRGPKHFGKNKMRDGGRFEHNKHREENDSHRRNKGFFMERLADSLGFTADQKSNLKKLNEEMDLKKDSLFEVNEKCKDLFSEILHSENLNKARLDSLTKCISKNTEAFNLLRISHMEKLLANCNAEQKKKLPLIFKGLGQHGKNMRRRHDQ